VYIIAQLWGNPEKEKESLYNSFSILVKIQMYFQSLIFAEKCLS